MRRSGSTCRVSRASVAVLLGWVLLAALGQAAVVVQPPTTDEAIVPPEQTQQPPAFLPPPQPASGVQTRPFMPGPSATAPGAVQPPPVMGQPNPQTMPLPPTYNPGSPAGYGEMGNVAGPEAAMPLPPTAYAPYDSAAPGGLGRSGPPALGSQPGFASQPGAQPGYGWSGTRSAGTSLGQPSAPTPTPSSQYGLAQMDPRYGPYQPANVEQATAPRQPATVGQARSNVLRPAKPFADYRKPQAYSPYMSLNRMQDTSRGINNYYEYVRPALEQQQADQRTTRDIRGLQETARFDQTAIQSGQRPGTVVPQQKPPATFMNYQQFFGGQGR